MGNAGGVYLMSDPDTTAGCSLKQIKAIVKALGSAESHG
jgi:hypothetical protein